MATCLNKLFGYNLECTRRVGYGGLYAEMIHNKRLLNQAEGFYEVTYEELKGVGQSTERLQLLSGKTYEWNILAGDKVIFRALTEWGEVIFESEEAKGSFISKYHCLHARIEVFSNSDIRYISLKPSDAWHECRRDVLDKIKELHPATIRVPGGCFAERYCWKDGLIPIEERKPITAGGMGILFSTNEKYDGHELNIDDYAAICRYVGAELEYTVRLTDNTPEDAADLVEYCNGDASTKYGALRISRGYAEPYNIKTWYIGNEIGFIADCEMAAKKTDAFVDAMMKKDSSIKTVVSTGNVEIWDEEFLKKAQKIDMCSHHYYLFDGAPAWDRECVLNAADGILFESLQRASKRIGERKLRFDEWNLRWGNAGDSDSALYAAGVMTMLIRNAENLNLDGASYFALVNEGAIRVYPDHVCLAPDGEVLKRMAGHIGGILELCDDETFVKSLHEGYTYVSVYNKSATEERELSNINGSYEILSPNGVWMNIESGVGELKILPPASVAFIRSEV